MSTTLRGVHAVLLAGMLAVPLSAQAPLPEVSELGPQVGDLAPPFELEDQRGQRQDLQSVMGPNGLLLAFNRSSEW